MALIKVWGTPHRPNPGWLPSEERERQRHGQRHGGESYTQRDQYVSILHQTTQHRGKEKKTTSRSQEAEDSPALKTKLPLFKSLIASSALPQTFSALGTPTSAGSRVDGCIRLEVEVADRGCWRLKVEADELKCFARSRVGYEVVGLCEGGS
jgi:hypothetical protein